MLHMVIPDNNHFRILKKTLRGKGNSHDVMDNDGRSSSRKAAVKARERISEQLQNEAPQLVLCSPSPGSVTEMN